MINYNNFTISALTTSAVKLQDQNYSSNIIAMLVFNLYSVNVAEM